MAATLPVAAGSHHASEHRQAVRVDRLFADIEAGEPGCALAVTRDGVPIILRGYGAASLEPAVPITPSTVFHVASVSKQFTAMAVALLVAEGRISWQDDIRKYVPQVPDYGRPITLRHLVTHTSGLRDQWDLLALAGRRLETDVITEDDVLEITSRQRALNFEPGAEHLYSNTGFTLLALVVERVTGDSLRAFTATRMFEPLGMTSTQFRDDHSSIVPNRAYGYARVGQAYRVSMPAFDVAGPTNLVTTIEDMARWERNFLTGELGGRAVLEDLQTRGVLANGDEIPYAAGLRHGRYRGLPTVGHGGADAGYRSHVVRFPNERVSIAVLCGFSDADPAGRASRVADIVLDGRFPPDPAAPAGEAAGYLGGRRHLQADTMVGLYGRPDTDALTQLRVRGRELFFGPDQGSRLVPLGPDRFRLGEHEMRHSVDKYGRGELRGVVDGRERIFGKVQPARPGAASRAEYIGLYWSPELHAEYRVELAATQLRMWNARQGVMTMIPRAEDRFTVQGHPVTFTRAPDGRIDGFTLSTARVWKMRFERLR
jgi:CubicO group peptidase (beta-lactamase class C family)